MATGQLLTWNGSAWTSLLNTGGGFANKFRNGTMDVWQRGVASMTVTTAGAYTSDGWMVVPSGANCTAQQVGGRGPTNNSLKVAGAASVTDAIVKQRIEGAIAAPLAGQVVTVQAQVYNNTGGSITPTLTVKHAGSLDNWASPTTDVSAAGLQSCANAAWTQVGYTFVCHAASGNGLEITFDFGNNFSTTGKSVQVTELDIRATPGVAAGPNSVPPQPELRPIGVELALCQRYFESSYQQGVAPGTVTSIGGEQLFLFGLPSATFTAGAYVKYKATKRIVPAVTFYSPTTGASGKARDVVNTADVTASLSGFGTAGDSGFIWAAAASAAATAYNLAVQWTSSAEL